MLSALPDTSEAHMVAALPCAIGLGAASSAREAEARYTEILRESVVARVEREARSACVGSGGGGV